MAELRRMTEVEAAEWLQKKWDQALRHPNNTPDPEMDDLVNSNVVSIRYAVITQLLGKFSDHRRDVLCLQRRKQHGSEEEGFWDPRGFCNHVIVPWVQKINNVLGSSGDPYVNKPLRRHRLDEGVVRDKGQWDKFVNLLQAVQMADDCEATKKILYRCIDSIVRRFTKLSVPYPVPNRVSLDQVRTAVDAFLEKSSGGERLLIVVTVLMRTIGKAFSLFDSVSRQGINEPDSLRGVPGDILCYNSEDGGEILALAVEVKDRKLTLTEFNSTIGKVKKSQSRLSDVLFVVPDIKESDREEITIKIAEEWNKGVNVYHVTCDDLIRVIFPLLGDRNRIEFLRLIGDEINSNTTQPAFKTEWIECLTGI